MAISRREIRQTVARMLSDFYEATATAGETNSLTDPVNLARETDFFKGMNVFFPDAPHAGLVSTVTQSDGPTRTIFFEPPLATSVSVGERVELYNFKGRGTTAAQYNASINDAIRVARDMHALIPITATDSDVFDHTTGVLTIPDEFVSISGISFPLSDGRARMIPQNQVDVSRFTGTITVKARYAYPWTGKTATFYGYGLPDLLLDDDDETWIESEWLFDEVMAQILERMVASGMPVGSQDRLYLQERTEAGGKRPMIVTRAAPNTIRIR